MWLLLHKQYNKWIFESVFSIDDTSLCKFYVVKFIISLTLLKWINHNKNKNSRWLIIKKYNIYIYIKILTKLIVNKLNII